MQNLLVLSFLIIVQLIARMVGLYGKLVQASACLLDSQPGFGVRRKCGSQAEPSQGSSRKGFREKPQMTAFSFHLGRSHLVVLNLTFDLVTFD